jgi:2-polyprenyl-6-methoxyphenol hydroxylase-like FAD-dependent oxidoreductase
MYDKDVLIIGAGPTGLTLAIELARRNVAFRLLDAAPMPFSGSRGKGLQPRTLEIFEDLGVIDEILASGGLYPKFRIHFGRLSFRAGSLGSSKPPSEGVPYPNLWMVPQARTEEILGLRLHVLGGKVEFDVALTDLTQDQQGVHAVLSNGERVSTQFLVGCDGAHSSVRKALELRLQGEALEEKPSLVADVDIPTLDPTDWHIWPLATGGALGLCPLPGTQLFQCIARAEATDERAIQALILRGTGHAVAKVTWSSIYRPAVRMVDRYRAGRVLLAGDAAHIHPPAGGQGLNTGVQDAYNLGWKLAHVARGGPESLLDTYEEERLPIAAAVLNLSRHLHQKRTIKRGEATNQLSLHYRSSSLSSGASLGTLHPGDRMPDRRLADGSRLFEHLRGRHATILVSDRAPRILIRPDGYIASIGSEDLLEYAGNSVHIAHAGTDDK